MSEPPRVDIALATYNGARFLPEQLDSLAAQTWPAIRIWVSDDGSSDDTLQVIEGRRGTLDLHVAPIDPQRDITRNFQNALRCTDAPYVALCDQDDVWDPRKIALLQAKVAGFEAQYGKHVPALAFCDLAIVDETLGVINASYFRSSIKSGEASDFRDFVLNNHVPGCAMLMNRALLDIALPFPLLDIHDHWLIQLAAIFGHIGHVDVPLVQYRQHGSNSIGLARAGEGRIAKALRLLTTLPAELTARQRTWTKQAAAVRNNMAQLRGRFGDRLPEEACTIVNAILGPPDVGRIKRALAGARHGDRGIDVHGVLRALTKSQG
ncbi:hypothetical protein ASG37_16615 [Sphingomonas sp. Leaf407]|uniref:glycosyltransferase family 2 protein n=1 Tax=unclassified Sphingomonas TaxID=196159 RepID=UPI0006FCA9BE|nr:MULTISPECIES: glycosyltransferase family 2 protein [unclassified Sphingomonas]KQN33770.1 hypothetical protein ASE97_16605 [Sphingomonas sp. Leaf42]KQT25051.1 hypothetical protein ASG37_16615 [Sphingomonas sp. Leaf407]